MEEKELLEKNLTILEKLANGINPIDDTLFPEDSPINNLEITRALYFALTKLKFANKTSSKKKSFYIEEDKLANFEFIQEGAYLSQIVEKLNQLIDDNKVRRLSRAKMVKWLVDIEILTTVQVNAKRAKRHMPTEQGLLMGLEVVQLVDKFGNPFDAVKYPISMQKFILDNLDGFYNWVANGKR
ncbi:MAG: hypothetical protein IKB98_02145 [Clostridia bacterium]|nr:hypothetical protein [Clostridia bacterium]